MLEIFNLGYSCIGAYYRDRRERDFNLREERQKRSDSTNATLNKSHNRAFMDRENFHSSEGGNIRSRLGSRGGKEQLGLGSKSTDRIDDALYDEEKVLDRDELERLRLANAVIDQPWKTNPEMVPRGNYFEVSI